MLSPLRARPASLQRIYPSATHAGLAHFLQPERMDARILIRIFDLGAAFLDADIGAAAFRADAALLDDRIAFRPKADGEIAGRTRAGIEMLVEHALRRRKDHAVTPFDALEIVVAFVPEQGETGAMNKEDVQPGPCRCPFL